LLTIKNVDILLNVKILIKCIELLLAGFQFGIQQGEPVFLSKIKTLKIHRNQRADQKNLKIIGCS
jgi:hypothetical protein